MEKISLQIELSPRFHMKYAWGNCSTSTKVFYVVAIHVRYLDEVKISGYYVYLTVNIWNKLSAYLDFGWVSRVLKRRALDCVLQST